MTKRVSKEDSLREGLRVTTIQRPGLLQDPEEASSSARKPSKAGGTEGERWAWASLSSDLRGLQLLFAHPLLAGPLPALPLRTHFADINTFMAQPVIKVTRPCPPRSGRKHCSQ